MAQGDTVGWMRARVLCDAGRTTLRSVRQAGGGGGPEEHRDKAVRKGLARGQEGLFHSPAINETWVLPSPIDARRSGDASDRMALGRRRPARRGWGRKAGWWWMGWGERGGISAPSKASRVNLRRTSACAGCLSIAHPSRWGRKRKTKHAKGWRGLRADHRFAPPHARTVVKDAEATSAPCMGRRCVIYRLWPDRRAAFRGGQDGQSGTTAVASISTLARSCISATTCTQAIAGKLRPSTSR